MTENKPKFCSETRLFLVELNDGLQITAYRRNRTKRKFFFAILDYNSLIGVIFVPFYSIEIAGHQSVGKPFFLVCLAVVIRNELVTKLSFQREFYWLFVASLSSVNVR